MSVLLTLTPEGAPLVQGDGPVAHVILCVDLSASMNHPDKYPVLTRALEGMIEDLQDEPAIGMAPESALRPLDWQHGEAGRLLYDCEPVQLLGGGLCK